MKFFSGELGKIRFEKKERAGNASLVLAPPERRQENTAESIDDLTAIVTEALASPETYLPLSSVERRHAEQILKRAKENPPQLEATITILLKCVRQDPEDERLQILAARAIEMSNNPARAAAVWKGLSTRYPLSVEALRMRLRWVVRQHSYEEGLALLQKRFPDLPKSFEELLLCAHAYEELRHYSESEQIYEHLIAHFSEQEESYLSYAQALKKQKKFWQAFKIIQKGEGILGPRPAFMKFSSTLKVEMQEVERLAPAPAYDAAQPPHEHASNIILEKLIGTIIQERNAHLKKHKPPLPQSFIGHVVMINGSLGPGGAERQFTTTACALQEVMQKGQRIKKRDIVGPITVCCRSFTSKQGEDFFLEPLQEAQIPVWEYGRFDIYGGRYRRSSVCNYQDQLRFLPAQMGEGTNRLADVLSYLSPDVAHLWQDGSIFSAGLAVLLAHVPRIVLSVRTLPPIDRTARARPEYEVLYKSLLKAEGVVLSANSRFAAQRYAHWLELDPKSIPIIYNGTTPPDPTGDLSAQTKFESFQARTEMCDFTIGCVIRFDENKRPFLWLDVAAGFLVSVPLARFIMVGEGPLYDSAQTYAEQLGIANRVLFVGRSACVGYWMKKMDVFMLLSRFEGLPNVLIEAQLSGVPVLTTPAGGAFETFLEGETGHMCQDALHPDVDELCTWLKKLRDHPEQRGKMSEAAQRWAREHFTVQRMLEKTLDVYVG